MVTMTTKSTLFVIWKLINCEKTIIHVFFYTNLCIQKITLNYYETTWKIVPLSELKHFTYYETYLEYEPKWIFNYLAIEDSHYMTSFEDYGLWDYKQLKPNWLNYRINDLRIFKNNYNLIIYYNKKHFLQVFIYLFELFNYFNSPNENNFYLILSTNLNIEIKNGLDLLIFLKKNKFNKIVFKKINKETFEQICSLKIYVI